jgi:hypothetical protein
MMDYKLVWQGGWHSVYCNGKLHITPYNVGGWVQNRGERGDLIPRLFGMRTDRMPTRCNCEKFSAKEWGQDSLMLEKNQKAGDGYKKLFKVTKEDFNPTRITTHLGRFKDQEAVDKCCEKNSTDLIVYTATEETGGE